MEFLLNRWRSLKSSLSNKLTYDINSSERTLLCHMPKKLAQLRANKSPLLQSYLHTVNPETYVPQCPLCLTKMHDTNLLLNCSQVPTKHNVTSLWKKPENTAEVIQEWESILASLRSLETATPDIFGGGETAT